MSFSTAGVEFFMSAISPKSGRGQPSVLSSPGNLVPIVLGGPWGNGGDFFERWHDWRFQSSYGKEGYVGVGPGKVRGLSENGEPEGDEHDCDELRAPRDWKPTPDTIPEGCKIAALKGVTRSCKTCTAWTGSCSLSLGNECCPVRLSYNLWCPIPEAKPEEKDELREGMWCWTLGNSGNKSYGRAVRLKGIDKHGYWTYGIEGCSLKANCLRPIKVGDPIKIQKAGTGAVGDLESNISRIAYDSNSNHGPHVLFDDNARWVFMENIRLID